MQKLDMTYFFPQVLQVLPTDNFEVYAWFNDGSVRLVDIKHLLEPATVFEPLMDINVFKEKLAVINDTVAWDMGGNRDPCKCVDLDPLSIFRDSPLVADPLT
jgi:hypothetical protein